MEQIDSTLSLRDALPSLRTRGYQQEMLDESVRSNIVIALDTGSGKTHIALLRMKLESERHPSKVSWFLTPTVALCEQQHGVIKSAVPVSVGMISGALEPDQWKDSSLWQTVIRTHKIVVSTPQVLLDAMRHGYIRMGRDIGLLVFDEAHHAIDNHPYRLIMKEFYFYLPARIPTSSVHEQEVRPMILGLTASPIFGGNVATAIRTLEHNLDATIRSSRLNRDELGKYVNRPEFCHVMYSRQEYPFSTNLAVLEAAIDQMDIEDDPYVISLRNKLEKLPAHSPDRHRLDQKLSKVIHGEDTFAHKGLRDFARASADICRDVGGWAADWYVYHVVKRAEEVASSHHTNMFLTWREQEKAYLLKNLPNVQTSLTATSYFPGDIVDDVSDKVRALIECLLTEKAKAESRDEAYSGIIFVQRRDTVYALATVLAHHPQTKDQFQTGCLVGSSESSLRHSFLDITRTLITQSQSEVLMDFALGEKNLLISTSVAEEGIDIQACGSVIRWDIPPNMVSWAQSRGRARRKHSTFVLMFEDGGIHQKAVAEWEALERQMVTQYQLDRSSTPKAPVPANESDDDDDDDEILRVPSTGALLTVQSAISHLEHFCAVIPNASHVSHRPIYELDPPDMPEGWHAFEIRRDPRPYPGPFGATVTLPRLLEQSLRVFTVPTQYPTKISALRHAAFKAYSALYQAELLNDSLLPLTSVIEPHLESEVKQMLADVEKRASMANVRVQMNPWDPPPNVEGSTLGAIDGDAIWWSARLTVEGLPPLRIYTRRPLMALESDDCPILYRPGFAPSSVLLSSSTSGSVTASEIAAAQEYTRRIFWATHGSRMTWDNLDFHYLFLPAEKRNDAIWEHRRLWLTQLNAEMQKTHADSFFANAEIFGAQFSYPTDLTIVRAGFRFAKAYRFIRWMFDEPSDEQLMEMQAYYKRADGFQVTSPLLVVQELPPRINFLHPPPSKDPNQSEKVYKVLLLDPKLSGVSLLSAIDNEYSNILPSIIRALATNTTLNSLRYDLFHDSPLQFIPTPILMTAITAPAASDWFNYQRLETLGDTVLKFIVGIQLLSKYRFWHEGYLSKQKDHVVSNVRLAKHAVGLNLYRWIIRDRMLGRKWKPSYFSTAFAVSEQSSIEQSSSDPPGGRSGKQKKKGSSEQLSTKVLADVVESLIGAAYLHGDFDLGLECARLFGLGIEWQPLSYCIRSILDRVEPDDDNMPGQLEHVEKMIGYNFKRKFLLIEALTHASYQENAQSTSYERLEFLGDSVLDMIITHFLYHAPGKLYSPGHIFLRRSAMVNAHILAYICLSTHTRVEAAMPKPRGRGQFSLEDDTQIVYLYQCLLHSSSSILQDQAQAFARYQKHNRDIADAFDHGDIYPWASLLRLQAPKFLSDMIESLLGAVYLDSNGNLDAARAVVRELGMMDILERIVGDGVDVLHPVSRVSLWAQKADKEVNYKIEKEKGRVCCVIEVDGEPTVEEAAPDRGRASAEEVKFVAAEGLIKMMRLRDVGVNYDKLKKKGRQKTGLGMEVR